MKKEEEFSKEAPKQTIKRTVYIKKVTEGGGYQIPHLNLIMIVGIIAFIVGMGIMSYLYGSFPKQYVQEIVEGGIRICYVDKCFWWQNCTYIGYRDVGGVLVHFCPEWKINITVVD